MKALHPDNLEPLRLYSVIIPARDEDACIAGTVQHLDLEMTLQKIPHEIVVVDDGSKDSTWNILQDLSRKIPALRPVQNPGPHGFGRAVLYGLDRAQGDAIV